VPQRLRTQFFFKKVKYFTQISRTLPYVFPFFYQIFTGFFSGTAVFSGDFVFLKETVILYNLIIQNLVSMSFAVFSFFRYNTLKIK